MGGIDPKVRPQDDFFRYVNGGWLERAVIPPDQVCWGSFYTLRLENMMRLKEALDWKKYFERLGVDTSRHLIVGQLGFMKKVGEMSRTVPCKNLQAYLVWSLISAAAPYLSQEFMDESFDFYGRTLYGQREQKPVWEQCLAAIGGLMGEALGKLYVARHFPPEAKVKIQGLVEYMVSACAVRIRNLDWMSEATKERALRKLKAIKWKLGYPDVWRDYSRLEVGADSYALNVLNAVSFEVKRLMTKVGKEVDPEEWHMNPQTVNAAADFGLVEMCFPAGILQPPFFNPDANDAANFGGIGMVIGHELFHHFDDEGSKYDEAGNLNSWWQEEDHRAFRELAERLVEQFNRCTLLGKNVNGKLTLGENISDLGGIELSFSAYQLHLAGKEKTILDGFTPEQRFFMSLARCWRLSIRNEAALQRLILDPHAPPEFRVNMPLSNISGFYEAFAVYAGDGMYRPPEERVKIW